MNTKQVDAHLDQVTILQHAWKNGQMKLIATVICAHAVRDRIFWADKVDLGFVAAEDRNCVGTVWRMLCKPLGILQRMDQHKRSERDGRKGGIVFKYRVANLALAKAFLKRNNCDVKPEQPALL